MSPPDTRTALARVRGLGAARSGVQHWWAQRLTAVALVPLSIWWVAGMIAHTGATRVEALAWIARPVNATLTILTLAMVFHHGQLGIQAGANALYRVQQLGDAFEGEILRLHRNKHSIGGDQGI